MMHLCMYFRISIYSPGFYKELGFIDVLSEETSNIKEFEGLD